MRVVGGTQNKPETSVEGLDTSFDSPLTLPASQAVRLMRDPARPVLASRIDLTEAYYAQQFAHYHGDTLRFDHAQRRWLEFDGATWRVDRDGGITRLLIEFSRLLQRQAPDDCPDPSTRELQLKFFLRMEQHRGVENIEALAQDLLPLACSGLDQWDTLSHLYGTARGAINLRAPDLPLVRAADLFITKRAGATYNTSARAPRWLTFLDEVFLGRRELIDWIHRALGYTLTGETREQVLFVLYGSGENGKSLLLEVLSFVMGDYAIGVPFSLFEAASRAAIPNDLAMLPGCRMATASETTDGIRLNEARIKAVTGEDRITARHLHREFFTFRPTAKFWLSVNHLPAVRDRSHGFWRRVRLIPFEATFSGAKRDDRLREVLQAEAEGILLWLVDGAARWYRDGLGHVPDVVAEATLQFAADTDPLVAFLGDCCVQMPAVRCPAKRAFDAYVEWADRQRLGKDRLTRNQFAQQMRGKFEAKLLGQGTFYCGVGLLTESSEVA